MRIFVTGATGFLGSHLVDALTARGDDVLCLVRDPTKAQRVFPDRKIETVQGDLSDIDALRAGCKDTEVVYHVAGVTSAVRGEAGWILEDNESLTAPLAGMALKPYKRWRIFEKSMGAPS